MAEEDKKSIKHPGFERARVDNYLKYGYHQSFSAEALFHLFYMSNYEQKLFQIKYLNETSYLEIPRFR